MTHDEKERLADATYTMQRYREVLKSLVQTIGAQNEGEAIREIARLRKIEAAAKDLFDHSIMSATQERKFAALEAALKGVA